MIKKTTLRIITFIILTVFIGRLALPLTVFAQEAPSGPSAPQGPSSAPQGPSSAPEGPSSASSSAPAGPSSAPSGPSSAPSGPTGTSSPTESQPTPTYTPSGNSAYNPTPAGISSVSNSSSSSGATGTYGATGPSGNYGPQGVTGATGVTGDSSAPGTSGSDSSFGSSSGTSFGSNDFTSSSSSSGNDPYNSDTGAGSSNYGVEKINASLAEVNKNLAEMENKINNMMSTGFNNANMNTMTGQILTGDVMNTLNMMNKLNSNLSGVGSFSTMNLYGNYLGNIALQFTEGSPLSNFISSSDTVAKNSATGPLSDNYSVTDSNFTVKEANGNDATLQNDIYLTSDSGNNSASLNTGAGVVETGDATALANIINLVNTNIQVEQWLFAVINIFGDLAGNIILPGGSELATGNSSSATNAGNQTTAAGSDNVASATTNSTAEFNNTNTADINSNLNVSAKTGNNDSNYNTGGGLVSTGVADASVADTTVANTNTVNEDGTVWLVIVNEMGKWVGHLLGSDPTLNTTANTTAGSNQTADTATITAGNSVTGPLSANVSEINQNSDTSVTNSNDASITNNIKITANSGGNDASKNTGAGVIETGNANAGLSLLNLANTNIVAKKLVVLFVNVIGSFVGDIIPQGTAEVTNGSNFAIGSGNFASSNADSNSASVQSVTATPANNIGTTPADNGLEQEAPLVAENSNNNVYYYYYPEDYDFSGYYRYQYGQYSGLRGSKLARHKNKKYPGNIQPQILGSAVKLERGTTFSNAFVKAVQSSQPGTLVGGISLKVTNSWLLILPLALVIYVLRRKNRIGIDLTRYINMLLDVIL